MCTKNRLAQIATGLIIFLLHHSSALAQARINASILPTSRYVQVGQTATAFATIINPGDTTAVNCTLTPLTSIDAYFSTFVTDPATNAVLSPASSSGDIAPGGVLTFVFSFSPNAPFDPTDISLTFDCDNTDPARVLPGVNTFLLGSSDVAGPDIVALAATIASDGITRAPGPFGTGIFSVATSNVGAAGSLTVTPLSTDITTPLTLLVCETDPALGTCLAPPSSNVVATTAAGSINSFGVFARGSGQADFAPATRRVELRFIDSNGHRRGTTSVAYTTQTEISGSGGILRYADAEAIISEGIVRAPVDINVVTEAAPPGELPANTGPAERVRNIQVSDVTRLDAPIEFSLVFNPALIAESTAMVLHYDESAGRYEAATIRNIDTLRNRIEIDSRSFSRFVTLPFIGSLPTAWTVPTFDPVVDSWNMANSGSYFSAGGNCLGMAAYATWWHNTHIGMDQPLSTQYSNAGGWPVSIAALTAGRAMLAQNQYWAWQDEQEHTALADPVLANLLRHVLFTTQQPQILILSGGQARHAVVVYGWDATGFQIYEVNTRPGTQRTRTIPYNQPGSPSEFGNYDGYSRYGFVAIPSLGRGEDFARLAADAAAGFPESDLITIHEPMTGSIIADRITTLDVSVAGVVADRGDAVYYLNGGPAVSLGGADRAVFGIPARAGENTVIVVAGVDGNYGDQTGFWNWSRSDRSSVLIRDFESNLARADFQVTMSYDNPDGDVDLYVIEPGDTGVYTGQRQSKAGLHFFGDSNLTDTAQANFEYVWLGDEAFARVVEGEYIVGLHHFEGPAGGMATVTIAYTLPNASERVVVTHRNIGPSDVTKYGPEFLLSGDPSWHGVIRVNLESGDYTFWR